MFTGHVEVLSKMHIFTDCQFKFPLNVFNGAKLHFYTVIIHIFNSFGPLCYFKHLKTCIYFKTVSAVKRGNSLFLLTNNSVE